MKHATLSWLVINLFAVSMLAGLGTAQTEVVQDTEADCNNEPDPNDPDWYDTETPPGGGVCQADTSRKDDVPPFAPGAIAFEDVDLNKFNVTWDVAYDYDTEDTTPYREDEGDVAEHDPPPTTPEGGNGTIDAYIVYNHTVPFTDPQTGSFANQTLSRTEADPTDPDSEEVPPATRLEFTGLEPATTMYIAVTAVDAHGNEGPAIFGTVTTPAARIVLSENPIAASEDSRRYEYNITVSGSIEAGKAIGINLTLIDEVDLDVEPIELSVARVELTPDEPIAWVTVNITDDDFGLGDRSYIIEHTIDPTTTDLDPDFTDTPQEDLVFTVLEDEAEPAINLLGTTGNELTEGTADNVTVQVKLSREPRDDVFLHVHTTNDTRLRLASDHFLRFGRADWDTYQNVVLWAPDNDDIDGDKPFTVHIDIIEDQSSPEYVDRATDRSVVVMVYDDEVDEDEDNILDSEDKDPEDRFNKDFRPSDFKHELSKDGELIRFTWTARHLDDRIDYYTIWEFSDPTNFQEVDIIKGQRYYNTTLDFDGTVHTYALQPVLKGQDLPRDGVLPYDDETSVPLEAYVFTQEYYDSICGPGAEDSDGDRVCDDFEELVGTDKDEADTDDDGRDDRQELFLDGTDPLDPESRYTFIPDWGRNPWLIIGSLLILAALVIAIASLAGAGQDRRPARS